MARSVRKAAFAYFLAMGLATPVAGAVPAIAPGSAYKQANLVSDVAGVALLQDAALVNPWGISLSPTSPFWVANNGTSTARIYREDPASDAVILNPTLAGITIPGGLPTGTVSNSSADFVITSGAASAPARFLFASLTGNISGWEPTVPAAGSTTAVIAASQPGHVYTGLTLANNGAGNFLYAADFANGAIDVFNGAFALQPTVAFPFADPTIPTTPGNTFRPYNIQNIGGALYVTYAKVGPGGTPEFGVGNGFVRRFNANGVRDLTFGINNGSLDAPWGIALAPASFGIFGGALVIGNRAPAGTSPSLHAFNPTTGAFLGTLQDEGGTGISIDYLAALAFGNGAAAGDTGALYFTAGIGTEQHGLFGSLRPTTATATSLIQFSATDYAANETSGTLSVTVTRQGDTSAAATVNYAALTESGPGRASASDFTLAPGTLTFAPGETSRTFSVAITNDASVEGNETLKLVLSNPSGAGVGLAQPNVATLTIVDNSGTLSPGIPVIAPGSAYRQANLVSDVAGIAPLRDSSLVNPWGISLSATSPFWVANNGSSTARIYREDPATDAVILNPGLAGITIPGGLPTGTVSNSSADFVITSGAASAPARFLFASITGNISGWEPTVPAAGSTTAVVAASQPGHVYTGLTLANNGAGNFLYAADFANGAIDVFNGAFALQPTVAFPFVDPTIPTTPGNTFHPYNVQNIGGSLYVTYAKVGPGGTPEFSLGNGFVRRFNANGVRDLTFGINNGPLDTPWGITVASPGFGIFGNALIIGNRAPAGTSPSLHAFNATTGAFLGTLQDESGVGIQIDFPGALTPGNGAAAGDTNALYFSAGIGSQQHGLFGSLRPTTATATSLIQFSAADYAANETSGTASITVTRQGDTSGASTVNYAAVIESQPGRASASDFALTPGTLTFAPGETSRTFSVAITNDTIVEGNETLQLVLSNPTGASIGSPNTATLTIVDNGTGTSNVAIVVTGPGSVSPGATLAFTLTVTNTGPDTATGVTTTDVLPAGVTFISSTASQGTCGGAVVVTCVLGTLASGATATVTLTVQAPAAPTTVSNTASVQATQADPAPANNTSTATVAVGLAAGGVQQVPTLSQWSLLLLAALLASMGMSKVRPPRE